MILSAAFVIAGETETSLSLDQEQEIELVRLPTLSLLPSRATVMSLVPLAPCLDLLGMTEQIGGYASPCSREDQSFAESSRSPQRCFHEIETFIAPISLFDELKIEQRSGKQKVAFRCDDPSVPQGEDNIVVRATNLFFEKTRITSGVSIELKKRIPHGAGLGWGK
jgi:hypothetical protein